MDELLPCPKCHNSDIEKYEWDNSWWAKCKNIDCGIMMRKAYEGNLIIDWNTRSARGLVRKILCP